MAEQTTPTRAAWLAEYKPHVKWRQLVEEYGAWQENGSWRFPDGSRGQYELGENGRGKFVIMEVRP